MTSDYKVDIILPYVTPDDPEWMHQYTKFTGSYIPSCNRFDGANNLKYLFRGIAENMPFINHVVLLLSGEGQIPRWLNTDKVRIVYHRDFIPEQFLPTFNSCTIECFLGNITDLSDKIIYFNDDIYPLNLTEISDFFTGDVPNIPFTEHGWYQSNLTYYNQCRNGLDIITNKMGKKRYNPYEILLTSHNASPLHRNALEYVAENLQFEINSSITRFRERININQNIYSYYHYYSNTYVDRSVNSEYLDVINNLPEVTATIMNSGCKLLCINNNRGNLDISDILAKKFPNPCFYEV